MTVLKSRAVAGNPPTATQVKGAMGRALARDPAIFLFDEPLSNLDAKLSVEMQTEIKMLHQRIKTTIVYVTNGRYVKNDIF